MSILVSLFLIGISLSMDTFSVCLSIGSFNISKKNMIIFPILVGIMHFFMPIFGTMLGKGIVSILSINANLLLGIILLFIAIEMILELIKKEEKNLNFNFLNMILIGLSVSLDSFSTGLGLLAITNNIILSGVIFSLCAASFTYLGLIIGKYSSSKLGEYGNYLGIILLIILGFYYIFK